MIIKSMSRKEASFGQLMDYIDRDGGGEPYRIRYNLLSRDRERVRAEFEHNADLMRERKNGVFMYHEIISITRAKGIDLAVQKERLHQIAQEYVAARAPRSLCYGGLHDDKDHSLHYHLMMSANRLGEEKRHRLSKAQFRNIQVSLERHVLETYPELEQRVAINKASEARVTRKEAELKRRTGSAPERDTVKARAFEALQSSTDHRGLWLALQRYELELYVRGSTIGFIDRQTGKRHRAKTLDDSLPALLEARLQKESERVEAREAPAGEKENEGLKPTTKDTERNTKREQKATLSPTQAEWKEESERRRTKETENEKERDTERDDESKR